MRYITSTAAPIIELYFASLVLIAIDLANEIRISLLVIYELYWLDPLFQRSIECLELLAMVLMDDRQLMFDLFPDRIPSCHMIISDIFLTFTGWLVKLFMGSFHVSCELIPHFSHE